MSQKKWLIRSDQYSYASIPDISEKLDVGVYELLVSKDEAGNDHLGLRRIGDDFIMPDKVYDLEKELISRVIKTFGTLDKNFGVLLKGSKGTGKTVTAKMIANKLQLPVILVSTPNPKLGTFIDEIKQEIVLVFDEFEKIYEFSRYFDEDDEAPNAKPHLISLLTMMDGVLTSEYKRLFLLTTNEVYLPDTLTSRPGRIRYIKEFGDMSREGIMEVFDDLLKNKDHIPGLFKLLSDLKIITIDIVKSLVEEVNLYDTTDPAFYEIFNLDKIKDGYDLFEVKYPGSDKEKEVLIISDYKVGLDNLYEGYNMHIAGRGYMGCITEISYEDKSFTAKDNKDAIRHFRLKDMSYMHTTVKGYYDSIAF